MRGSRVHEAGALGAVTKSSEDRDDDSIPDRVKDSVWMKVGVVAAVLAAIIAAVALMAGGVNTKQDCNIEGDGNIVQCHSLGEGVPGEAVDKKLREDAARFADVEPKGNGPWPFAVVGTLDQGLKVRSTNVADGEQLGGLAPHYVAWAVCQARSEFDPDPTTGTGPVWLKIKWEQQEPSDEFHESDSGAKATAWAYRGYLVPIGHNGDIPAC